MASKSKPLPVAQQQQPVGPDQMLAKVKERIEALEDKERTEEEIERGVANDAREALATASTEAKSKSDPYGALESKYVELYQDHQRRQRDNMRERQKLITERDVARTLSSKLASEKKKLEELSRALSRERNVIREEHKKLESRVRDIEETQRNHLNSISALLPTPIPSLTPPPAPAAPAPLPAAQAPPSDLLICVSSRYRAELWFKIGRTSKLSRLFNAWSDRMEGSTTQTQGDVDEPVPRNKKGKQPAVKPAAKLKFMFTLYGKVVDPESTPEELDLCDRDEMVAFELLDLTENVTGGISSEHVEKLKKQWPVNSEDAKSTLEEMLEIVTRERLKNILRQYDLRETHWISILKSKELELLLAKARLETAQKKAAQAVGSSGNGQSEVTATASPREGIYQQESLAIFTSHTANLAKLATTLDDVENLAVYAVQESKNARNPHVDQAAILQQGFAAWRSNLLNVVDIALEMNRRWGGKDIPWSRPVQKVTFDPIKAKAMMRGQSSDPMSDVD